MSKYLILFLLISTPALAGDFVCHSGGTITEVVQSRGEPYYSRADCLSITRTTSEQITKYYKVDPSIVGTNDDKVVEMNQAEKDAVDAAEVAAQNQLISDAADDLSIAVEDVIVALVKRINVRIPGNPITKQEVIDQIKADKGL